ncbi:MAG: sugar phosphate isomerase/epimerase family protein [Armatimonadota bacterium]
MIRVGVMEKVLRVPREELFRTARDLGFDGVELELREPLERVRARSEEAGVPVCSLICDGDGLGSEETEQRLIARARLEEAVRETASLGARGIMLPEFSLTDLSDTARVQRFGDDVRACLPLAEEQGVTIGWENALDAASTRTVLEWLDSPAFRCYYDFANGARRGADPAAELRELEGLVYQVHAKNLNKQPLDAPGVDLRACLAVLREQGYQGWIVLETAPGEDARESARHNLRFVRGCLVHSEGAAS